MQNIKKFTFKTHKPIGKYKCFEQPYHQIKFEGKVCGSITDKPHQIRLMVYKTDIMEDGNPNCAWKWITFKNQFETLAKAKDWLNEVRILFHRNYKIYVQSE